MDAGLVVSTNNLGSRRPVYKALTPSAAAQTYWCGRRDLNPHDFRRWNLNPVRLPVPPRPRPKCRLPSPRHSVRAPLPKSRSPPPSHQWRECPLLVRRRPALMRLGSRCLTRERFAKTMRKCAAPTHDVDCTYARSIELSEQQSIHECCRIGSISHEDWPPRTRDHCRDHEVAE